MKARKEDREIVFEKYLDNRQFDSIITSYEGANICKNKLRRIKWSAMIIDEAHRIKNELSLLSKTVRMFYTDFKLLLSGTPL